MLYIHSCSVVDRIMLMLFAVIALCRISAVMATTAESVVQQGISKPGFVDAFMKAFKRREYDEYHMEFALLSGSLVLILYSFWGRRKTEGLAMNQASQLLSEEEPRVVQSNFSVADGKVRQLGPGAFAMYFTGRKYISGCLVTLRMLPSRWDLVSRLMDAKGARDALIIEVAFLDGCLPTTVLVMGTAGAVKIIEEEHEDVKHLTKKIDTDSAIEDLQVHAEHSGFYQSVILKNKRVMSGFMSIKQSFRSLHITDSYTHAGRQKAMLRFCMDLPMIDKNEDGEGKLKKVLALVMDIVDASAVYSLSPEGKKKAENARKEWETKQPSVMEQRRRRMEENRIAKQEKEKKRLAAMTPAQREKEKARKEKIEKGRRLKSVVKRV